MTGNSSLSNRNSLFIYLILAVIVVICHFVLGIQWVHHFRAALEYYEDFSLAFVILIVLLIPFRWNAIRSKGITPEARTVRFFGPIIDLAIDPFYDASLFYCGLFIFHTIFSERPEGLSLEPFLILALVAGVLVYQALIGAYKLGREIFFAETTEKTL